MQPENLSQSIHVFRIAIKVRITIPETKSCSKEAGSRLKKYRRRCGMRRSEIISQLYQRFRERGPMLSTTLCTTVCDLNLTLTLTTKLT